MTKKKLVSIVIPCFNEEQNILFSYKKINKVIANFLNYNYEFIYIDNGSTDKTKFEIRNLCNKDARVKAIILSRNFGPESSVWAGMMHCKGDAVVTIECDMQSPPHLIKQFLMRWEEGYNIIVGIYRKNEDNAIITYSRKIFYSILKKISNIDIPINASGVGLMDRKTLEALKTLPEKYRLYRGLRAWIGFKTSYVTYNRDKRVHGNSSYSFFDYVKHAERGLFGFSYLLLDMMIYVGFIVSVISFILLIGYIIISLLYGNPIKGSITILFSVVFFGGVQLLAISIIGKYIQVIVEEVKNRPVYIIDETINLKK